MEETLFWQRLLRDALAVLASEPDEQVRLCHPGCVSCELLDDFGHARTVAIDNAGHALSDEQKDLIRQINEIISTMAEVDYECFNNEVIRRPLWQGVRDLAKKALHAFGWEGTVVGPFVEMEPGVWKRPRSEDWIIRGK